MPARNSKPPPIQLIAPSGFLSIAGNLLPDAWTPSRRSLDAVPGVE
jgi:hypothetical protein